MRLSYADISSSLMDKPMQNYLLLLVKSTAIVSLLSLGLAACTAKPEDQTSSNAGNISSVTVSSVAVSASSVISLSSLPISSSSLAALSSSSVKVSSSSMPMSSSSTPKSSSSVASSSAPALDCSSINVTSGETSFNNGPVDCNQCHGTFNGDIFPGVVRKIDPNALTETTSAQLAKYIEDKMAKGYRQSCNNDAACVERAKEMAKYINRLSDSTDWCAGLVGSNSSSATSSSVASVKMVDLYAINAGGNAITTEDGTQFSADFYTSGGNVGKLTDLYNINGVRQQDLDLYRTERWGKFTYNFPLKDGTYDVKLYIMEGWFGPQTGRRVFDVRAENKVIVNDLDPLAVAGHDVPHIVEVKAIKVSDGKLTLDFEASVDQASIRAIVVRGPEGSKLPYEADMGTVGTAPVPSDCTGGSAATANDFVVFDGAQTAAIASRTLGLHGNWKLQEVWDANALFALENVTNGKAIAYSNARQYTGFKLAPPSGMSGPMAFSFDSIELHIDYVTSDAANNLPKFGVRLNYEGEAAPDSPNNDGTRVWLVNANNQEPYSTQSKSCNMLKITPPQGRSWTAAGNMGTKLILEVKTGWDNADKLRIRRMVFKNFQYKK